MCGKLGVTIADRHRAPEPGLMPLAKAALGGAKCEKPQQFARRCERRTSPWNAARCRSQSHLPWGHRPVIRISSINE